jgi:hypothetical protein
MAGTIHGEPGAGTLTGTRILGIIDYARAHAIHPDADGNYWLSVSAQAWHRLRVAEARAAWQALYRGVRLARKAGARVRVLLDDQEVA